MIFKSRGNTIILSLIFVLAETALGIAIQNTSGDLNILVSYVSVVLSCLFCLLCFTKTADYTFTQIALIFTVLADLCLVVIQPMLQLPAMVLFSITQLSYFARLYIEEKNSTRRRVHLIIRIALVALALAATAIVLGEAADPLAYVSLFYYANLITNIIFAFTNIGVSFLFPIGLLFFALCDAQIGLNVLAESYISVSEGSLIHHLAYPDFNFAWMCYVPSQTLIALSLVEIKLRAKSDR